MQVVVAGASGATGRLLVEQLLDAGSNVRAIVRSTERLPDALRQHSRLTLIEASILNLSDAELTECVQGCDAVASCLGHNMNFKGIFGRPRRLVAEATSRLCKAIRRNAPERPVKFVLMNSSGNSNRDLHEPVSFAQQCIIGIFRVLLPPHADNEKAADFLRTTIGQNNPAIEWVAVRPDTLLDENQVTEYDAYPSPVRSAIFDPGSTSRINVAHFMKELIVDGHTWSRWKGQMPVIYNRTLPQ